MLKYSIPQTGDEILFEASLEPSTTSVDKMWKSKDMNEGEITAFLGKKNKVAVGVPYYENLISKYREQNEEVPREIELMSEEHDFHLVKLSCSLLPDPACRFTWARFGVELHAKTESGMQREQMPIVWDMFPDEVMSEVKYSRDFNFAPKLKFNLGVVSADIKLIDVKTHRELILYEPQIIAFGLNTSTAMWNFRRTEEKGIWGNKRDLLLVVRAPKNSRVKGRFLLGAEVEYDIGRWIPIPIGKKRDDEAVNIEYPLSG